MKLLETLITKSCSAIWRSKFTEVLIKKQQEELVNKLNEKLGTKIKQLECNVTEVVDHQVSNNQVSYQQPQYHQPQNHLEERDFYKWLNDNIEVRRDATLTLKEVCERYLKRTNVPSGISCRYKCDIENYTFC
jgi:hypothetical protein